jgi:hypothetical protein
MADKDITAAEQKKWRKLKKLWAEKWGVTPQQIEKAVLEAGYSEYAGLEKVAQIISKTKDRIKSGIKIAREDPRLYLAMREGLDPKVVAEIEKVVPLVERVDAPDPIDSPSFGGPGGEDPPEKRKTRYQRKKEIEQKEKRKARFHNKLYKKVEIIEKQLADRKTQLERQRAKTGEEGLDWYKEQVANKEADLKKAIAAVERFERITGLEYVKPEDKLKRKYVRGGSQRPRTAEQIAASPLVGTGAREKLVEAAKARAKARPPYKQPNIRSRHVPEWERFPGEYGAVTDPSEGESTIVHGELPEGQQYEDLPHTLRRADDPRGLHPPQEYWKPTSPAAHIAAELQDLNDKLSQLKDSELRTTAAVKLAQKELKTIKTNTKRKQTLNDIVDKGKKALEKLRGQIETITKRVTEARPVVEGLPEPKKGSQRGAADLQVLMDILTGGTWRFANPQTRKDLWRRFRGTVNAWFSTGSPNVPASVVTETNVMDHLVEAGNQFREDYRGLHGGEEGHLGLGEAPDPQIHEGYKLGSVTPEERAKIQEILKRLTADEQFMNTMLDDPTPYLEEPSYETDRLATIEETGEIAAARSEEVHAQRQQRLDQQFERGHPDYPVTPYPEQQAALDAAEAARQARLKAPGTLVPLPDTLEETVQLVLHEGGRRTDLLDRRQRGPIGMLYDVADGPPSQELLEAYEDYVRAFVRRNAHDWTEGFSPEAMMEEVNRRFRLAKAEELGIRAVPDRSILPPDISSARGQLTEVPSVTIQDAADRTRLWNKYLELRAINPEASMKEAAEALGIEKRPTPPPEEPIKYGSLSDEAVLERASAEARAKQPTLKVKPDPKRWSGGKQYIPKVATVKARTPGIGVGYAGGMVIEALIEAPGVLYEWNKRIQGETKDERLNRTLDYIYTRVPAVATFGYSDIIEALYTMSSAEDPAAASREYGKGFGRAVGIVPEEFPGGKEVYQDPIFDKPLGGLVSYDPTGDLPPGYLSLSDRPTSAEDIMEERLRQEQHLVGYEQPFSAEEQVQLLRGERLKTPPGSIERRREVIDISTERKPWHGIPSPEVKYEERPTYDVPVIDLEGW